jgi:membrane-bound lytic murein transglycosylase D
MPIEEVCRLNPGYLKRSTAPTGTHVLLLPVRKADRVANRLAALSRDPSRPTDPGEAGEQIAERQEAPGGGVAAVVAEHSAGENGQALAKTGKGRAGGKAGALSLADTAPAARAGAGKTAKVAQRSGKSGERRIVYVVRKGDTLWAIARKHEVRVADLVRWNGINPKKDLSPGQRLSILREHSSEVARAERSRLLRYTVRNGDTLASLSSRFRVSQTQLRAWNSLQPQADIVPGQRLALFLEPAARQS